MCHNSWKSKNYEGCNKEKTPWIKQKTKTWRLRAITFAKQGWKSDNFLGSTSEIRLNNKHLKSFRILGASILISATICMYIVYVNIEIYTLLYSKYLYSIYTRFL